MAKVSSKFGQGGVKILCAHTGIGPRSHVSFGTWKTVEKGFIPLGWGLTLFQVENSHVMEWWRIDSEKRAFCSNYMCTITLRVIYTKTFFIKIYHTLVKKIQKICSFQQFLPSSVFNTALTGKWLSF